MTSRNWTENENTPRLQWPSRSDSSSDFRDPRQEETEPEDFALEIESAERADAEGTVRVWGNFGDGW